MAETLPQFFLERVREYGAEKVALRQKEYGIWREYTWQESYAQVRDFGLGLLALGLDRGAHVATIGDNDRQYLWAYLGLLAIGGVQVGLFTDANPDEAAYIIHHSDAQLVLAQDQEQVDKMLEIRDRIPNVRHVVYWDERGLWGYDDPWLLSFEAVQAAGRDLLAREPDRFEAEIAAGRAEDLMILCYTSGTTGRPKGAMITHGNMGYLVKVFNEVDERQPDDNHVSLLPLGWIAEHAIGVAPHVLYGVIINFPEEPETVRENVREIAPQGILYNSRLWDALVSMVQVRLLDASWLNKLLYRAFLPIGYRVADRRMQGQPIGAGLRAAYQVGDWFFFGPLRDKLGMARMRSAYTAGAALSPDVMRFFHAIGVNLKQIYGSTETTGGVTTHRDGDIKFASVGTPVPGCQIRIAADGEIQIASPSIFQGYYKNPEKTDEAILVDEGQRWFRTGDAGYIDEDGHLIYLDRVKDMITLANGERFSPQFIEGRLKFNPYIRDVMAIGDPSRDFATALITLEFDNAGKWAEKRGIGYTTFADLSQQEPIRELVRAAVAEVNRSLPPTGRVQRFVLMHKEFDADEAEMTRSRKLRRGFLVDRYGEIIEAMYAGQPAVRVRSTITYQDGSSGVIENEIHIMTT